MRITLAAFLLALGLHAAPVRAETVWYPLPAEAYQFGQKYPEAQRLLFAFDYGHALLYERLLLNKGHIADPAAFEKRVLDEIMAILRNPPPVKVSEEEIAPAYAFAFPLVLTLFDWSHYLHQFIYDVLATATDRGPAMTARVNELTAQFKANGPIAITDRCKTMLFMDGQYFSKAFRRTFPSLNLLIWSYHWLQVKLYDALLLPTEAQRDAGVAEVVRQFWALVADLPDSADFDMMPETAHEAPAFARAFPDVPPIFDNLHMLHDIISDILVSDRVTPEQVRPEGIRFGRMAQDPAAFPANVCASR